MSDHDLDIDLQIAVRLLAVAENAAILQGDPVAAADLRNALRTPGMTRIGMEIDDESVARFTVVVAGRVLAEIDSRTIGVHWIGGELLLTDVPELDGAVIPDDVGDLD